MNKSFAVIVAILLAVPLECWAALQSPIVAEKVKTCRATGATDCDARYEQEAKEAANKDVETTKQQLNGNQTDPAAKPGETPGAKPGGTPGAKPGAPSAGAPGKAACDTGSSTMMGALGAAAVGAGAGVAIGMMMNKKKNSQQTQPLQNSKTTTTTTSAQPSSSGQSYAPQAVPTAPVQQVTAAQTLGNGGGVYTSTVDSSPIQAHASSSVNSSQAPATVNGNGSNAQPAKPFRAYKKRAKRTLQPIKY